MGNNISGFPNGLSGFIFNNFTANNSFFTNDDTGIFQTAGLGNYYLATNSPFPNAGTTGWRGA
jgi:hypothetical protein